MIMKINHNDSADELSLSFSSMLQPLHALQRTISPSPSPKSGRKLTNQPSFDFHRQTTASSSVGAARPCIKDGSGQKRPEQLQRRVRFQVSEAEKMWQRSPGHAAPIMARSSSIRGPRGVPIKEFEGSQHGFFGSFFATCTGCQAIEPSRKVENRVYAT